MRERRTPYYKAPRANGNAKETYYELINTMPTGVCMRLTGLTTHQAVQEAAHLNGPQLLEGLREAINGWLKELQTLLQEAAMDGMVHVDAPNVFHAPLAVGCMEICDLKKRTKPAGLGAMRKKLKGTYYEALCCRMHETENIKQKRMPTWVGVHRLVCWAINGPPPTDMLMKHCMHSCNNPPCCNPLHLAWGAVKQNLSRNKELSGVQWLRNAAKQHLRIQDHQHLDQLVVLAKQHVIDMGNLVMEQGGQAWWDDDDWRTAWIVHFFAHKTMQYIDGT